MSSSADATFQGNRYTPPDNEVNCGTSGFVAGWSTGGWSDTSYVHGFWINCANGTLTLNNDNTLSYSLAKNGVAVSDASPEMKAALARIGEQMAAEWEKSAGPDGQAILKAYRSK